MCSGTVCFRKNPTDCNGTIYGAGCKLMSREAEPGAGVFQRGMFSQDWRTIQGGGDRRGSIVQPPTQDLQQGQPAGRLDQVAHGPTQPELRLCSLWRRRLSSMCTRKRL